MSDAYTEEAKVEKCNIILADSELNDLEDDYWANCTLPTTTVTRATALAQLKKVLEWLQPYVEENHNQVIIKVDKTDWYKLCSSAGLRRG